MDRDGFVEFVQHTFVERKTKDSKGAFCTLSKCQNQGLLTFWNAIAQFVQLACIKQQAS